MMFKTFWSGIEWIHPYEGSGTYDTYGDVLVDLSWWVSPFLESHHLTVSLNHRVEEVICPRNWIVV